MTRTLDDLLFMLQRIEDKLDKLIATLAKEEEQLELTLDGDQAGTERDATQPL